MIGIWEGAKNTCRTAVVHQTFTSCYALRFEGLNLRPVHSHQQQTCNECPKDLRENVMRNFPPGKTLPDREADCNCGIEVTSRGRSTGNNGESDTDSKPPANLEDGSEGGDTDRAFGINCEGRDCCNTGKAEATILAWRSMRALSSTHTHKKRLQ